VCVSLIAISSQGDLHWERDPCPRHPRRHHRVLWTLDTIKFLLGRIPSSVFLASKYVYLGFNCVSSGGAEDRGRVSHHPHHQATERLVKRSQSIYDDPDGDEGMQFGVMIMHWQNQNHCYCKSTTNDTHDQGPFPVGSVWTESISTKFKYIGLIYIPIPLPSPICPIASVPHVKVKCKER